MLNICLIMSVIYDVFNILMKKSILVITKNVNEFYIKTGIYNKFLTGKSLTVIFTWIGNNWL